MARPVLAATAEAALMSLTGAQDVWTERLGSALGKRDGTLAALLAAADHRLDAAREAAKIRAGLVGKLQAAEKALSEAQDDAVLLALRDQEIAGLDIVTDGEQRPA